MNLTNQKHYLSIMEKSYQHLLSKSLLSIACLFIFSNCGDDKKKKDNEATDAFNKAKSEVAEDIDKVLHDIPSPSEIPFLLQSTGAEFNPDLLSDITRANEYETSIDKAALNLGIYATNVGYLASYEQVQLALNYMEGCQSLAEIIGVASSFDLSLLSRFEENLGKRDSLAGLLDEGMKMAEQRLGDDDRLNTAALVLAGSFIEGIYLAVMIVETYPEGKTNHENLEPLIEIILDQKQPLLDLIVLMEDLPIDNMIDKIIGELKVLKFIYEDQLKILDEKLSSDNAEYKLSKGDLASITYELKRIRNKIRE